MQAVVVEGLAIHRLVLEQVLGDADERIAVLGEYLFAQRRGLVEDALDLLVYEGCGLLRIALGRAEIAADEDAVVGAVILDGAELFAHAVAGDHVSGDAGGLLDIAGRAGRDIVKEQLFGNSAAEAGDDALEHLRLGGEVLGVLVGTIERKAACHAARDDGYIVHGVRVLQKFRGYRVAGLVVSGQALCLVRHLAALFLRAHLDLEYCLVAVGHRNEAVLAAHSQQRCLVHEVFKVSAREAGRALCD